MLYVLMDFFHVTCCIYVRLKLNIHNTHITLNIVVPNPVDM